MPRGRNVAQDAVKRLITPEEWESAVRSLWEIATQGTKPDWAYCPHCSTKVQLDRVDLRARADAAAKLQEMGFGKPREDEDKMGLVVKRTIVAPKEVGDGVRGSADGAGDASVEHGHTDTGDGRE